MAYKLGRAGGYVLTRGKDKVKVVVGRDTRISGDMLEASLISGLMSVGCDVITVGVIPTPGVAYLTRSEEHTSELQSRQYLVCRLLLEKKKNKKQILSLHRYNVVACDI